MKERMVWFSQNWSGTSAASGSAEFVTKVPLTFHSGGIFVPAVDGGSIRAQYVGTAQGTVTLYTNSAGAGSCYIGTAAFSFGTPTTYPTAGGTTPVKQYRMHIPVNGTIRVAGTASTSAQWNWYLAFLVDEFGGTAYT
jgi:hypothetical protein